MVLAATVVLAMAVMMGLSEGYSTGARMNTPMETMKSYCTTGNLRPGHGTMSQRIAAPFELIIPDAVTGYKFGTPVEITIRANPGKTFKGFFITGDAEISTGGITGTWSPVNGVSKATKFCGVDGMTHTSGVPKTEVKVRWSPPQGYHHGHVQFKATVVMDKNTFWTGLLSKSLSPPTGVVSQDEQMQRQANEWMRKMQEQASQFGRQAGGMDMSALMGGMGAGSPLAALMGGAQPQGRGGNAGGTFQRFAQTG